MGIGLAFIIVLGLILFAYIGTELLGLKSLFAVVFPYVALIVFLIGFIRRMVKWGKSPVPFRIPTTGGQQFSLPWIKYSKIDNPATGWGAALRMFFEIAFFRSLFRNTKAEIMNGKLYVGSNKWLWIGALAFHYSFLIILVRHLRFFIAQTPWCISVVDSVDSFWQIGLPMVYMTDIIIGAALLYLLGRRIFNPQVKYISLPSDYFPLFLIIGIIATGVLMRYFARVDITAIKELTLGLAYLKPSVPEGIGSLFYIHLFLVSVLFAYFPFSKLMHMGGVFLSPTRNLANNNRMERHVNPWDYPVKHRHYEEYEDEFREKMKKAGIPVEKE
ncbi:sulfate reduction electron transfer complex DsrMKJOP subunit DsrM [Thermodesulfovibrio sp. Kuro-1]|uniref:sulfate reduction electron transfer complex DsrMKJOP subunit DsrM n=1 Tax=Thermodesulfovibrio sp. Kuro-1 TaxID=2580394 RepID=UPI001141246F|nr:sulfate reduction electron transfer complex DsrMKJOP subunit DsrM [Thermodesulfovibrio sp. Kuro-1]